jgi:hypothetical protein
MAESHLINAATQHKNNRHRPRSLDCMLAY